jgi:hypothetical protein
MRLCKYRDLLGKPNKGFHKYGAIGDWAMTIIMALVFATITYYATKDSKVTYPMLVFLWFIGIMILAVFLHWLFCVKTRFNVFIGL